VDLGSELPLPAYYPDFNPHPNKRKQPRDFQQECDSNDPQGTTRNSKPLSQSAKMTAAGVDNTVEEKSGDVINQVPGREEQGWRDKKPQFRTAEEPLAEPVSASADVAA